MHRLARGRRLTLSCGNSAAGSLLVYSPVKRVTTTVESDCWQMTQRVSFSTKRSLATHLEQVSV